MKVIFLDFDGVVNNISYDKYMDIDILVKKGKDKYFTSTWSINNLEPFKELLLWCQKEDIKIVISSSWRILFDSYSYIEEMFCDIFKEYSYQKRKHKYENLVIGRTKSFGDRGLEILQWLNDNSELNITNYIVVDDEIDYDIKQYINKEHYIHTDNKIGLTNYDVYMIKNKLIRKE